MSSNQIDQAVIDAIYVALGEAEPYYLNKVYADIKLKRYLEAPIDDELIERRFQRLEEKLAEEIKKIKDNDLQHLELTNMPDVKVLFDGIYSQNIFLNKQIGYLEKTLKYIKFGVIFSISLSVIISILKIWM